jgi:signal transduction histidine kinase
VIIEHFSDAGIGVKLPDSDPYVLVDPVRIRLLLKNLLENALRHTPLDRPAPSVKVGLTEERFELVVEDFGEGIAPEHLDKITDPFYRADPSRQRGTGGFGLGLYLCRSIAAAHRGELTVESVLGQGSKLTFTMSIPKG